jgi:hypothetical protein
MKLKPKGSDSIENPFGFQPFISDFQLRADPFGLSDSQILPSFIYPLPISVLLNTCCNASAALRICIPCQGCNTRIDT